MWEAWPQVEQFQIVGGEARPSGPYVGQGRARGLGNASLYVVVEPTTPAGDALSGQVVSTVRRHFRRENLSLTGALLRSLQAAHEELTAWNRLSLREQRTGMGVSCLALRQGEVFLAQVAPALAYLRSGGSTQRLVPAEEDQPLGLAEELRPTFSRHLLAEGDALLLAFTSLAPRGDEAVAAALAYPLDEALRRLYALVNHLPHFAALLVAYQATAPNG